MAPKFLKLSLSLFIHLKAASLTFLMGFLRLKSTLMDNSEAHCSYQDRPSSNFPDVSKLGDMSGFTDVLFK